MAVTAISSIPSATRPLTSTYYPGLTGIRAFAALLVLMLHAQANVPVDVGRFLPFIMRGYLGVDLFFILSGFILTHVYLEQLSLFDRGNTLIFLWHRLIRLYPVHLTILLALAVIVCTATVFGIPLHDANAWKVSKLIKQLLLVHAWTTTEEVGWNAVSWSISAEWLAYLLFPLLAPWIARLKTPSQAFQVAAAALVVAALFFFFNGSDLATTWVGLPVIVRVECEFVCGAALCKAVMLRNSTGNPYHGDHIGAVAIIAFLVGALMALTDFSLVALLAVFIFGVATSAGYLSSIFSTKSIVWLGEISYSIYMVHFVTLRLFNRFLTMHGFEHWGPASRYLTFAGALVVVILLAAVLYHFIEYPLRLRLRNAMNFLAAQR